MADEGFKVNDFEHFEEAQDEGLEQQRINNGWGLVREDLVKYHVHMLTDIRFIWSEDTPPELRKVFIEASHVLHQIAEKAVMQQLRQDGLSPVETKNLIYGDKDGKQVILRDTGWRPVE